jgi:hypothetical protein
MIGVLEGKLIQAQTKLHTTQQGYAAALARLKDAAKPVAERIGLGGHASAPNTSVLERAKSLWDVWRLSKPSVSPKLALQVLAHAAK